MTVTELRDALNVLIEQGHGDLPIGYYYDIEGCGIVEYDTVDRLNIIEDGGPKRPGPMVELE